MTFTAVYALHTMSNAAEVARQRQAVEQALTKLALLIRGLPASIPEAQVDGPLATYFQGVELHEEGPWVTIDRAYNRVFQDGDKQKQMALITKGPNGMSCVHQFLVTFSRMPGIEAHDQLRLVLGRVEKLIELTAAV